MTAAEKGPGIKPCHRGRGGFRLTEEGQKVHKIESRDCSARRLQRIRIVAYERAFTARQGVSGLRLKAQRRSPLTWSEQPITRGS